MESLNVFIHADAVHRAVRASELTGCTDATELQKIIAKKDNSPSYLLQPLYRQKVGRQP